MPEKSRPNSQEVAVTYATYLGRAKARRGAVRKFAFGYETEGSILKTRRLARKHLLGKEDSSKGKGLSEEGRERLDEIYKEQLAKEQGKVEGKIGSFSTGEQVKLIVKTRFGRMYGVSSKEKKKMYAEAGDEPVVTGKSFASSFGVTVGLTALSEGVRFGGVVFDRLVPLIEAIPGRTGAVLSAAGYTASYTLFAWESKRLTEQTGASANATVTGLYAEGERFRLPPRVRDTLAIGGAVAADFIPHTAIYTAGVGMKTDNLSKITAGNLTSIGLTLAFTGGSEMWLRRKMRKDNKTKQG